MRSPNSLESRPLRAREKTTKKAAAVLTASWATAGEAMDREAPGGPRRPQTPEGHTPTNERRRLIVAAWVVSPQRHITKLHSVFFRLVPSLRYRQAWCCVLVVSHKLPAAGAGLQPLCCCPCWISLIDTLLSSQQLKACSVLCQQTNTTWKRSLFRFLPTTCCNENQI